MSKKRNLSVSFGCVFLCAAWILSALNPEAAFGGSSENKQESLAGQKRLASILENTGQYCVRLKGAALNFVCQEEVTEKIDYFGPRNLAFILNVRNGRKNVTLYDYQVLQRSGLFEEKRTLLEDNGRKVRVANAELKLRRFSNRNVILGPIGILHPSSQSFHDYRLLGEEEVNGEAAFVVEAIPKSGVEVEHLYGKVWVKASDSSVLKIEWRPESMEGYEEIMKQVAKSGYEPRIALVSEYGFEKNGIRFPSKCVIIEKYGKKRDPKKIAGDVSRESSFSVSETTVLYRNYKFFTVQTDVVIR